MQSPNIITGISNESFLLFLSIFLLCLSCQSLHRNLPYSLIQSQLWDGLYQELSPVLLVPVCKEAQLPDIYPGLDKLMPDSSGHLLHKRGLYQKPFQLLLMLACKEILPLQICSALYKYWGILPITLNYD